MKTKLNKIKAFSLIELSIVIVIVGLLIAGITKGVQLYSKMKIASARSITANSIVPSISGLEVWYETSKAESFEEQSAVDGLDIENWYDINPNSITKNHLRRIDTRNVPNYEENCINGLPCINFVGSDQEHLKGDKKIAISGYGPGSIFLVTQVAVNQPNNNDALFIGSGASNKNLRLDISTGSTTVRFMDGSQAFNSSALVKDKPSIISLKFNNSSANSRLKLYINGVKKNNSSSSGSMSIVNDLFLVGSGHPYANYGYFFDGKIAEIIIYNKEVSESQRKSIEKYLSQKYNITIN